MFLKGTAMKRILVGKIATAHGIRGDVKVLCYADDPELLFRAQGVFASEKTDKRLTLTPKSEPKPGLYIATVKGIADRNAAELLRATMLYIDRDDLPELDDEDTVYHIDMEGMQAVTPEGKVLGTVLRVQNFGASDLLDIQGDAGNFYIPFCAPYLVSVDHDAKRIVLLEPEIL